jgi:hypothetical protein
MIPIIRSNNILIIRGITVDEVREHVNKKVTQVEDQEIDTFNLPSTFTTLDKWPRITTLMCWECAESIDDIPCFIPHNPAVNSSGEKVYKALGAFCSWNCVAKYASTRYGDTEKWEIDRNIKKIIKIYTGTEPAIVLPSPDKTIMKKYCGNRGLTVAEYKEKIRELMFMMIRSKISIDHVRVESPLFRSP